MKFLTRVLAACILAGALAVVTFSQTVDGDCAEASTQQNPSPLGCTAIKYNRFDDRTTVSLDWMLVDRSPSRLLFLSVSGSNDGSAPKPPDFYILYVSSLSNAAFEVAPDCRLTIIADDQRMTFELFPPVRKTVEGAMSEVFGAQVGVDDLRSIASGKSVAARLCYTGFPITKQQSLAIGRFLDRTQKQR